jgi:hypothetical protein
VRVGPDTVRRGVDNGFVEEGDVANGIALD